MEAYLYGGSFWDSLQGQQKRGEGCQKARDKARESAALRARWGKVHVFSKHLARHLSDHSFLALRFEASTGFIFCRQSLKKHSMGHRRAGQLNPYERTLSKMES